MYAALYEPDDGNEWHVTYWTGCSNDTDPDANMYGWDGLFHRKGRTVVPGSLVDLAIQGKKAVSCTANHTLDSRDDEGLIALAKPLVLSGVPAKVHW